MGWDALSVLHWPRLNLMVGLMAGGCLGAVQAVPWSSVLSLGTGYAAVSWHPLCGT